MRTLDGNHELGRIARIANATLGVWLFVSIFVWPHTPAQGVNVALTGLFITLTALAALSARSARALPHVRLINAALGFWLLVSILGFPTRALATQVNSAIVGLLVIAFALVPPRPLTTASA